MEELKKLLNSRVNLSNLCDADIVKLSQDLDKLVVAEQLKLNKGYGVYE